MYWVEPPIVGAICPTGSDETEVDPVTDPALILPPLRLTEGVLTSGPLTERLGALNPTFPGFTDGKLAETLGASTDGAGTDPPKTPNP